MVPPWGSSIFLVQEARGPELRTTGQPAPRAEVAADAEEEAGQDKNLTTPNRWLGKNYITVIFVPSDRVEQKKCKNFLRIFLRFFFT